MLLCKPGSQHACATAITPMESGSLHRCAVMQEQCTAELMSAKQLPHCSVLLCKTGSQHACATANYTYGDLLFIQVCSDATPKHCKHWSGQNSFPAVWCCSAKQAHSMRVPLQTTPMEICSSYRCATPKHCNTGECKTASPLFSAAL